MAEPSDRLIRYRATSIVARNGKVLLLREPQDTEFHLPGGGIEQGELAVSAAARELREETGLVASELEYLFDYCELWGIDSRYDGQVHHVFRADGDGEVVLSEEHSEFTWWDGDENLPVLDYVRPMLCMLSRRE